jgi:hypothetical protein
LLGVNGDITSNATWDGCVGGINAAGTESSRAVIPAGRYSRNIVAAAVSPARAMNVQTNRCASRCGAPLMANRPCVVFAATMRASPTAVRGPVPAPPCIRHRPFAIASPRHEPPARVRAPQSGARPGDARNAGRAATAPRASMLALKSPAARSLQVDGDVVLGNRFPDGAKGSLVDRSAMMPRRLSWVDLRAIY